MQQVKFHIMGDTPLIMHKDTLVDPIHPMKKAMKSISDKKKKTDEDHMEMARIEWKAGLHYDESGPCLPATAIVACIKEAAKLQKKGKDFSRGALLLEPNSVLLFDGPKSLEVLYGNGRTEYVDRRSVKVGTSRVMRTRPIFKQWATSFTVMYNELMFNRDEIIELVNNAGSMIGLLEIRPYYGKFHVHKAE